MSALKKWELPGFVATVIGLLRAFFVFILEQNQVRNSVEAGTCRLFSGNYPEAPRPVAALLARIALPEKSHRQFQQNSARASYRSCCTRIRGAPFKNVRSARKLLGAGAEPC